MDALCNSTQLLLVNIKEPDECIICLEDYNADIDESCEISETFINKKCKCKYHIHKKCLIRWMNINNINNINNKNTCLICNSSITLKESCNDMCARNIKHIILHIIKHNMLVILLILGCIFLMYLLVSMYFKNT